LYLLSRSASLRANPTDSGSARLRCQVDAESFRATSLAAVVLAALAIAPFAVSIVLHNVLSAVFGGEEPVSFIIALLVAPGLIAAGTLGVAVTLSRDARFARVGTSLIVAGVGGGGGRACAQCSDDRDRVGARSGDRISSAGCDWRL
jgi:hypothetical protein